MAVSTQSAQLVRQKAYAATYGFGTGTSTDNVSPYHFYAIKQFFLHWAINKGNPDLEFLPFDTADTTVNGGTDLVGAACTLYVWHERGARTSGTTAAYEAIHDAADNTSGGVIANKFAATGDQFTMVWPNGFALATGLTVSSATSAFGTTESTASNSGTGFVIIGAA